MKLTLQRTHANALRTWGKLFVDGVFVCYTLEDAVREVRGQPVSVWKVQGATAIPSTTFTERPYIVTLENSPRFGPATLTINDVPGYVGVRMHAGNFAGQETFFKEAAIDANKELLSTAEYVEVL